MSPKQRAVRPTEQTHGRGPPVSLELSCKYPWHTVNINSSHTCVTYALQISKMSSGFLSGQSFITKREATEVRPMGKARAERQARRVPHSAYMWLVLPISCDPSGPGFHSPSVTVCHLELISASLPTAE